MNKITRTILTVFIKYGIVDIDHRLMRELIDYIKQEKIFAPDFAEIMQNKRLFEEMILQTAMLLMIG